MKKNNVLSTMLCLAIGGASGCYGSESESKETVNIATGSEIESVMDDTTEAPWTSVEEVRNDIYKLENGDLSFDDIKGRVKATADNAGNDVKKIEDAIDKLYETCGYVSSINGAINSIKRVMRNYSADKLKDRLKESALKGDGFCKKLIKNDTSVADSIKEIEGNMKSLFSIIDKKNEDLVKKIINMPNKQEIKDFIRFVVYKISLNTGRYDFKSVAGEMIDLYECTKSDRIRGYVRQELQGIEHDDK